MGSFITSQRNRSILLLIFSVVAFLALSGRAVYMAVKGMFDGSGLSSFLFDILGMLACAGVLLPISFGCINQLRGRPLPQIVLPPVKFRSFLILFIIWIVTIIIASLADALFELGWLLSAPAFLVAISLPVVVLSWIGAGGLARGTRHRFWAAFGLGMAGSTGLALFFEYLLVGMVVLLVAVIALIRPELRSFLQDIQNQVTSAGSMEEILTLLAPYLTNPWIFLVILFFAAVLTPIIEEAVKPLAVWVLGRSLRSPAEGFALGALGGAGFALLEGLLSSNNMMGMLYFGLPARAASTLMHITLSAMLGWGITSALLEKRKSRLIFTYLLCVSLHGLWNASALLAVYGSLRVSILGFNLDSISILSMMAGVGMILLVFIAIAILLPSLNYKLRTSQSDIIAPLASQPDKDTHGLDPQSN